jgi:hypothetical protein
VLRELYAWGLTDVASSPWFFALLALLVGNLLALSLRLLWARRPAPDDAALAASAPHQAVIEAAWPERAVEGVRAVLARALGRPAVERVEGPRVLLAFETAPRARLTPLLTHVGLVLLVLGAVLATRPPDRSESMVRALLVVTEPRSGSVGRFDLAQEEVRTFFQLPFEYVIRDYVADRAGLGPALRMERLDNQRGVRDPFWIYLEAPPGFDARHREGAVEIVAEKMGLVPKPGSGLPSRPEAVLLLIGLAFLAVGARELERADGRLIVEAEGRSVRVAGVPRSEGDARFGRAFRRWAGLARWSAEA